MFSEPLHSSFNLTYIEDNAITFPSPNAATLYAEAHVKDRDYAVIPFNSKYDNAKVHELIEANKQDQAITLAQLLGE